MFFFPILCIVGAAALHAPAILPPHPRLLLTPSRGSAIAKLVATNAQAASYYRNLSAQADEKLPLPPVAHPDDDGNVLGAAREALLRTYALAAMWRLTRNASYASRAAAEVLFFTTQWSNWQPTANALVMGELSHAAAIGLDWLYDFLPPRPARGDCGGPRAARRGALCRRVRGGRGCELVGVPL
jgi:hypothetical protein